MSKKNNTPEQIVTKLREADVMQSKGETIAEASRQMWITETTYYKWRKEYGGLKVDQAKRFKQLEQENTRLKKLVADLSMDNAILDLTFPGFLPAQPLTNLYGYWAVASLRPSRV